LAVSLDQTLNLLNDAHAHYRRSAGRERRQTNQAVFRPLFIYDDEITEVDRTDLYQRLLAPDLDNQLRSERHGPGTCEANTSMTSRQEAKRKHLRPEPQVVGSSFPTLVAAIAPSAALRAIDDFARNLGRKSSTAI
jgi:hypothetical protein